MKVTIAIKKGRHGFLIGQLKELPDVFTQGKTVDEVKENILDALDMYLEELGEHYEQKGNIFEEIQIEFPKIFSYIRKV